MPITEALLRFLRWVRAGVSALVLALAPAAASAEPALQDRQSVPGSIISLTPPPDFTPAGSFSGFQTAYGASILVNELPIEAEPELYARLGDLDGANEALGPQGVQLERAVDLPEADELASLKPIVYAGRQRVQSLVFEKWVGLYVGEKVAMVTYQAPVDAGPSEAVMRSVFASVRLSAPLSLEEQLAALPYAVGDPGALALERVLLNGASLYRLGEIGPETRPAILIIAPAIGQPPLPPGQRAVTSEALIRSTPSWTDISTDPQVETAVSGAPTILITGAAVDEEEGYPLRFKQWMLFEAGASSYLRIVASAPDERWAEAEPAFDALVDSLELR